MWTLSPKTDGSFLSVAEVIELATAEFACVLTDHDRAIWL